MTLSICWGNIIIIIFSILGNKSAADMTYTMECNNNLCQNAIIDCLPNEDCLILCTEPKSCMGSIINCPLSGECKVECRGGAACQETVINATLSSGDLNIECRESTDHCKKIKIYGSILETNNGDFNMLCDGNVRGCVHSDIHCPVTGDCNIHCKGDESCRWSHITGPIYGDLAIYCNGEQSCFDGIFDGSTSNELDIKGCKERESCLDVTLYCPPHTNMQKHCFIEGNNNLAQHNNGGIQIYAINGWNDIEIDYSGSYVSFGGKMVCGENYDNSCKIASNQWRCSNIYDHCNFEPSPNPTTIPTNIVTSNPSNIPTINPTLSPTLIPTLNPTNKPTPNATQTAITDPEVNQNNIIIEDSTDEYDKGRVKWQIEILIAIGVTLIIMIVMIGMYCFTKNLMQQRQSKVILRVISNSNEHDAPKSKAPKSKASKLTLKSYSNESSSSQYDEEENIKTPQIGIMPSPLSIDRVKSDESTITTTNTDGSSNFHRQRSVAPSPPDPETNHHWNPEDIETALRQVMTSKDHKLRRESDMSAVSNITNASQTDVNERNIIFLNPMEHISYGSGQITITRMEDTDNDSNSSETSVFSSSDESSDDSDMFILRRQKPTICDIHQ